MRDPLLDMAQREGRINEAQDRAKSISDFDQATKSLAAQCVEFVAQCKLDDPESTIPAAFLDYLGTSGEFSDVATHGARDGLRNGLLACLGGYEHALRDVSALLLARAAAAALVQGLNAAHVPAVTLVPNLFHLCAVDPLAYDALIAALKEALKQDEPARKATLAYLGECVDDINQNPGQFVYEEDRETFDRHVREWRENPLIADVWRGSAGQQFLPSFGRLNFVDAVLGPAPVETLEVLDRLRFPEPLDWVLTRDWIRHDRKRISELTRAAPSSVDGDGAWNGSIVALLLLKEADNHCRDYWRAIRRNDADVGGAQELISSWLMELAAIVMRRNDGVFLATHWLLMKSVDERVDRAASGEDDRLPQLDLIGWIGSGLAEAGLKSQDLSSAPHPTAYPNVEGGSQRPGDAGSLDLLALTSMLDQMDDKTVLDSRVLLSRLDDLLDKRDSSFDVDVTFDVGVIGFVDSSIGYLLAMEDCADRWKRSWDRLTEQRRIVQHWQHTKDGDALAPSLFLVRAGLAALDWLCSDSSDRREVAQTLWRTMFDALRECWLTITLTHLAQSVERDIGRLFSRHPAVFGASFTRPDSNLPYGQLLADDLEILGGDDVLMARCCELVSRNLQDQTHLHDALRCNKGQGESVLRQFVCWQELERRVMRKPQLLEAVERILADVGKGEA